VVGRRDGDIMQMYADTNLANNELGWKAELGLEQMLDTAWKWELALKEKNK
jgi:UDP-glucose 4-epimerase